MMAREIGSEFWTFESAEKHEILPQPFSGFYCRSALSGRTALDIIIQDLLKERGRFKVYLPSYCCHTMIEPFVSRGIITEFYTVSFNKGLVCDFNEKNDSDVIFLLDYFGFENQCTVELAKRQKLLGKIIIYDATQSVFSCSDVLSYADYAFLSLRKWSFVNCAFSLKRGDFNKFDNYRFATEYMELRKKAAILKNAYIENGGGEKSVFLGLYSKAEEMLERDYVDFVADVSEVEKASTLDIDFIKQKRRNNAGILLKHLVGLPKLNFISESLADDDCPLFVPVFLDADVRDALRRHLIEERVYCPVHWPISDLHPEGYARNIFCRELSLICDQRYDDTDMKRIVTSVKEFFEKNE